MKKKYVVRHKPLYNVNGGYEIFGKVEQNILSDLFQRIFEQCGLI